MTEGAPSEPVRKQRMGARPQPESSSESPAETPTAVPQRTRLGAPSQDPGEKAAPTKTRMGASPPAPAQAPAAKTRMGASPPAPAATEPGTGSAVPDAPAASRSRLGGGPSAVAPAEARSSLERTPEATPADVAVPRTSGPWVRRIIWIAALLIGATAVVLFARWLRELPGVAAFVQDFPGVPTMSDATPEGIPAWMGWQHFFNMFFLVLIVRTGLQVRNEKKSPGYFTAKRNSFFSPKGATPKKVSLTQWIHQALDVLWILNGLIFVVLLLVTNQWLRIVPTSWDVVPNAISAGLQYASLEWSHENGWIHYNALQMLAYTVTVFVAAPLAVISGLRLSTWWPDKNARLSKIYPVEVARALHFPVMLYFVAFTVVHVLLVFLTGTLRNLNHIYTSRDTTDWIGLLVFLGSLLVIAAAWFLTKPLFMRPVAQRFGTVAK